MSISNYKYDVAFSFTQQDENLATTLYALLKDRLKCFIYSEEQKNLAGRDGEELFNAVYSKETRIVVIFFRKEYGETKWTRIEQTAIRNRGYEDGYDFVILIPTENHITPPKWLPRNRLWVGLDRWGIEAAAGVIEARVQEFGGIIKVETIADIAAKAENEINARRERENLLNSSEAIFLAKEEVERLKGFFRVRAQEITDGTKEWRIKTRDNRYSGVDVLSYGYILYFHFYQQWANTLHDAYLFVVIFKGYFDEHGNVNDPFAESAVMASTKLRFDINELNERGWSLKDTRTDFISSLKLADTWFKDFISYATVERQKNY